MYDIYLSGRRIVAHLAGCELNGASACHGEHEATATKAQLNSILSGKSKSLGRHDVTYPSKSIVNIGCTSVSVKTIKRLAALLP